MKHLLIIFAFLTICSAGFAAFPCAEDANKICVNDVNTPTILDTLYANEGNSINVCLEIFDCNTGEETSSPTAYHSVTRIKYNLPTDADFQNLQPSDCNSFSYPVSNTADCKDCFGNHCSKLFLNWSNPKAGVYTVLSSADNKNGGRRYFQFTVNVKAKPPKITIPFVRGNWEKQK